MDVFPFLEAEPRRRPVRGRHVERYKYDECDEAEEKRVDVWVEVPEEGRNVEIEQKEQHGKYVHYNKGEAPNTERAAMENVIVFCQPCKRTNDERNADQRCAGEREAAQQRATDFSWNKYIELICKFEKPEEQCQQACFDDI